MLNKLWEPKESVKTMTDSIDRGSAFEDDAANDVVASKRRLISKSGYVIPGILALSVTNLANAQDDIDLNSPPAPPNP